MMRRILFVLLGAIGDVTRALPLAVRLKAAWPECHLTWAVEPASKSLVLNHPAVDRVVVFERSGGVPAYRRFLAELKSESYDITLDLQRHLKSGFTAWQSRAPRRIGFHRRNSREANWLFQTEHIAPVDHFLAKTEQFQLFGDLLGLPRQNGLDFGLEVPGNTLEEWRTRIYGDGAAADNGVGFLLGSTWPSRIWPVSHFVALARELARRNRCRIVLIGGPADQSMARKVEASLVDDLPPGTVVNLAGGTTLRQLAEIFRVLQLAVGADSGPMHIASAVGLPVISLWGPTSPRRSAPYKNEHLVLQSAIGCAPCYRRTCPGLGQLCLTRILPEAVAGLASELMNGSVAEMRRGKSE